MKKKLLLDVIIRYNNRYCSEECPLLSFYENNCFFGKLKLDRTNNELIRHKKCLEKTSK